MLIPKPSSVPYFPFEDSKLRATSSTTRVGGNCPNSLQVLQQLFSPSHASGDDVALHLVSCLPARSSPASQRIASALAGENLQQVQQEHYQHWYNRTSEEPRRGGINLENCIYREDHTEPASSYIFRSAQTGSRTIVNYNSLPEMSGAEFKERVMSFDPQEKTWWHFEVSFGFGNGLRLLAPNGLPRYEFQNRSIADGTCVLAGPHTVNDTQMHPAAA